jgi:hypothetical protein
MFFGNTVGIPGIRTLLCSSPHLERRFLGLPSRPVENERVRCDHEMFEKSDESREIGSQLTLVFFDVYVSFDVSGIMALG